MELKSVEALSVAKIMGLMYAAMGILFGAIFGLIGLARLPFGGDVGGLPALFFGAGALIFLPVLYGCMGFVIGGISAWLYNILADLVGGVHVQLEPPNRASTPLV
jgi:hypothetical protein